MPDLRLSSWPTCIRHARLDRASRLVIAGYDRVIAGYDRVIAGYDQQSLSSVPLATSRGSAASRCIELARLRSARL